MHEIDLDNLPRRKTYDWFNSFNNPTYGLTVKLDVTSLVEHTKKHNESFFLHIVIPRLSFYFSKYYHALNFYTSYTLRLFL